MKRVKRNLPCFLPLSLILLLAALLRFYNLSGQSLWSDEGNSVALARRGFVEIAQRTAFDIHPPLYYWLLKIWITFFGDSETGLRSLSVVLGVGLVYLIGLLGARLFNPRVGLIAAFIAAVSPFQVYYSQEARMYVLLTFLTSLTVLAMLLIFKNYTRQTLKVVQRIALVKTFRALTGLLYILTVTAGLYTHYAYPVIFIIVNLIALIWFWQHKSSTPNPHSPITNYQLPIINWFVLQLLPLLLYLPWLPTAWRQVTTWPSEQQAVSLTNILSTISTTLLFGLSWPYGLDMLAMVILGTVLVVTSFGFRDSRFEIQPLRLRLNLSLTLLWLWLLLPVALTIFIFSPAFLKFLLVATPPLSMLLAVTLNQVRSFFLSPLLPCSLASHLKKWIANLTGGLLLTVLTGASLLSLYHYYTNVAYARDDYRGIVQFIKAVGGPEDAIILNAEGQQDVFNYYYEQNTIPLQAPVYPLPRRRPLDEAETLAELQHIGDASNKVYGVYWATHQADPNGLIEDWLDMHLFKATDQWYGNVRLVSYASPQIGDKLTINPVDYQLGQHIRLTGYALLTSQITPGDILQVALRWKTGHSLTENYTVFLQILDQANHLVGQRDAQPLTPSRNWPSGEPVFDAHGIFIEPGTPPGAHRLIVGLYDSETGQRLPVNGGEQGQDFIELGQVEIIPPPVPLPLAAFNIQTSLNEQMLEVGLLGYDFYKLGHRSAPDTSLRSGDPVQLVAYWTLRQPAAQLPDQLSIRVVKNYSNNTPVAVTYPLAGVDYPVSRWQPGEIIRAQYDFFLSGLQPGSYRLMLAVGDGAQEVEILSRPFWVE